eukprot:Hpha_TRINITY_DN16272_c0_g9::TRINITY_DN16272_c0_g9_i1::g.12528::m.12528
MGGCCRWGWLVRQGDTPYEARIKTNVFPFVLFVFMVSVVVIVDYLTTTNQMMLVVGFSINAFATASFMGGAVSNVVPAGYLLDMFIAVAAVGVSAMDLGDATISSPFRAWALVVLLLDIALVFNRYHMPRFVIPFVLVCQAALQVESVSRFGLYEAGYWGTKGVEIS